MPQWNPEELKAAIAEHSVVGYHVVVPHFGKGVIDMQTRPDRGGFIYYRVVADKPMPFAKFVSSLGIPSTPMTIKEWIEKHAYGSRTLPAMAVDLMEQLEAGGKVSRSDVLFRELMDRGCIDENQLVYCFTFPSTDVVVDRVAAGMLVEISEGSSDAAAWPGRISKIIKPKSGQKVVLVEQFAPVPFMRTPEALLPEAVKESYALPVSWTFGYGLVHAMEDAGVPLPPGQWSEDKMDYILDKPVSIDPVEDFCKKNYPNATLCVQQALMLHTLPLVADEITVRPLPEGTTTDVVVEIAPIEDPETASGVEFPREEQEEGEEWKG